MAIKQIMTSSNVTDAVRKQGFCFVPATDFKLSETLEKEFLILQATWDRLPVDTYMKDGGNYRLRRYDRFRYMPDTETLQMLPNVAFLQDKNMNKFAGGIERKFESLEKEFAESKLLRALITFNFNQFPLSPKMYQKTWEIKVHQIRIRATPEHKGMPAPEGPHKDGGKFFALHLISKKNIIGAENPIYDNDKKILETLVLEKPLDSLYVENAQVYHYATPVQVTSGHIEGTRDVLILGYWLSSN